MADETQKIYCMDSGSSINPMLSALLSKDNGTDAATMALLNNQNGWNNNPFAYLIWLMAMRWMNWDNNGNNTAENFNSRQIAALQDTISSNHNSDLIMQGMNNNQSAIRELAQTFNTDINAIQAGIAGVQNAISTVGGQVGMTSQQVINSVLLGNKDLTQALQSCCCDNKMLQMQNFSAAQLQSSQNQASTMAGMENVRQAVVNGFANIGYAQAQQTNDLLTNANANTQRIIDTMNQHWQAETALALQDEKFKNSQLTQTQQLLNAINSGCNGNS